jgi:hypothetical protein
MDLKKLVGRAGFIWLGIESSKENLVNTLMTETDDSGSDNSKAMS